MASKKKAGASPTPARQLMAQEAIAAALGFPRYVDTHLPGVGTYPGHPYLSNNLCTASSSRGLVPAGTHPLALHRACHLVVVQVPLEFRRHGLYLRERLRALARRRLEGTAGNGQVISTLAAPAARPPPPGPGRAGTAPEGPAPVGSER